MGFDALASWPWTTIVAVIGAIIVASINLRAVNKSASGTKTSKEIADKLDNTVTLLHSQFNTQAKQLDQMSQLLGKALDGLTGRPL